MKRVVRSLVPGAGFALAIAAFAMTVPADAGECPRGEDDGGDSGGGSAQAYRQINLVSSERNVALRRDRNLINPWGIAFPADGDVIVANEGTGTATRYDGNGVPLQVGGQQLVIRIPGADGKQGHPTGVVYNRTAGFRIDDGPSRPATFLFAGADGLITAYNQEVDRRNAITVIDRSGANEPPIYLGITIASDATDDFLYAADFHNGRVDVWNSRFDRVSLDADFEDPNLPDGYAPFNIENINGALFVTYAVQDEDREEEETGAGLGLINVFDTKGNFLRRLVSPGDELDAPWGLAFAPANFGRFSNMLLVGNFGDGRINAYDIASGRHQGELRDRDGRALENEGLWGIKFGNDSMSQPKNVLFFAAGVEDETEGLYGRIEAVSK